MTRGYLPRVTITKENGATRRRTEYEPASVALRVHCAELLLERGHGKPHQAVAVLDPSEGGRKSLRDLILASMLLPDAEEPETIEGESEEIDAEDLSADDDEIS